MMRRVLRGVAIAICIAGAIDPAMTSVQREKPEVALIAGSRLPDQDLVDRVARSLESRFTVIRGASINPAAVVSVGYQLPAAPALDASTVFAVSPEPREPFAAITAIDAPPRAQLQAQVPITVRVQTLAARGRTLTVTLESGGIAIDVMTRAIAGDDTTEAIAFAVVPSAIGVQSYAINAQVGATPARADFAMHVGDDRWAVLFFDPRPSWMSTFVRRAAEADPRFVVTSRVSTSRGAAASAGRPPESLTSLPSLELFHAVVIGAPDALSDADVTGLDRFMRARGGTVVLLMDVQSERRPFERLTGVTRWSHANRAEPAGELPASEFLWPTTLPAWAEPIDTSGAVAGPQAPPAIWQTPTGRGRLIVSGALDAWRYRDRKGNGGNDENPEAFDRFWRSVIATAAAATPPLGDSAVATVPEMAQPTPDQRELIRAWTSSHGGDVIPESRLPSLGPALNDRLSAPLERRRRHPLRSAWWIVPFGLALGGEWWLRRRQGDR